MYVTLAQRSCTKLLSSRWHRWLLLLAILLLALFLRVYRLDALPPGLHYDEAFNGMMARNVLRGVNRPIFFTGNFGEEPLHMYAEALLFAGVGESPWTMRLSVVFFGVLCVAGVYASARAWFPAQPLAALAGALVACFLYWAVNFSRIAIETNALAMMVPLSAASLGFAYRRMTWRWIMIAGVLLGGTLYTYLAARVWFPAVGLWFLYLAVWHRKTVVENLTRWLALALIAIAVMTPLVLFFLANPLAFAGRSGQVLSPETLLPNLVKTGLMFFADGDLDPRDNLPGRPALDLILAVFFLIGLVLSLRRVRQPPYAFLLIWLGVMTLPSALTEFAPNFRRALGAMPATVILCSLGIDWLVHQDWSLKTSELNLQSPSSHPPFPISLFRESKSLPSLIFNLQWMVLLFLLVSAFWNAWAYFVEWASNPGLFYSFDAGILRVASGLAARPPNEQLYISPRYNNHPTVLWAMDGREFRAFDGRNVLVLGNWERAATYGIITYEDANTSRTLIQTYNAQPLETVSDFAGKPYATLLAIAKRGFPDLTPPHPVTYQIGDFGVLTGWSVSPTQPARDQNLEVELRWLARATAQNNYTVFVHLVGPANRATGSPIWAQDDAQPGSGSYPTGDWRSGETILDRYALQIPAQAPRGEYKLEVGMYWLETGARQPILNSSGVRQLDDTITLTTLTLP